MGSDVRHIRRLNNNYAYYYASTSEIEAIHYMNKIGIIKNILLATNRYPPIKFRTLCTACKTKDLTNLPQDGTIHFTPNNLPDYLKKHFALLGIDGLVETEIKHIFFVSNPNDFQGILLPNVRATADTVSRSIFISDPKGDQHSIDYAAIIGHEAWHIRHNDDYIQYILSEPDAYQFEIGLLKKLGEVLNKSLSNDEENQLSFRLSDLSKITSKLRRS